MREQVQCSGLILGQTQHLVLIWPESNFRSADQQIDFDLGQQIKLGLNHQIDGIKAKSQTNRSNNDNRSSDQKKIKKVYYRTKSLINGLSVRLTFGLTNQRLDQQIKRFLLFVHTYTVLQVYLILLHGHEIIPPSVGDKRLQSDILPGLQYCL